MGYLIQYRGKWNKMFSFPPQIFVIRLKFTLISEDPTETGLAVS